MTTATKTVVPSNASLPVPNDADASGRSFGVEELRLLKQVLDSGVLISQYGKVVPQLEKEFAQWSRAAHCVATSSGTSALHTALAVVDPAPGDEIISSPITDMGAVMPIVYQSAVPVFADVDPLTCNVTAETIAPQITDRTRAILVTHLFGCPVDMDPILALARPRGIKVIEDAAQALGTRYKGKRVGTLGDIGCFSLQQGKHITCGEGGFVVTNDANLGRRARLFHDKGWNFHEPNADHHFLGLNYRMTELQGAVALAQLAKLEQFVAHRRRLANRLSDMLASVKGLLCPTDPPFGEHVHWRYPLRVVDPLTGADLDRLSNALRAIGARTAPRYTQKLAFEYGFLIKRHETFGGSGFPFVGPQREGARELQYDRKFFPGAVASLENLLCIGFNERYDDAVVERIGRSILDALK